MAGTGGKQESPAKAGTSKVGIACIGVLVAIVIGIFALVVAARFLG